jgi:hypothetical protein
MDVAVGCRQMQFRTKALLAAGADGGTWFAAAAWPGLFLSTIRAVHLMPRKSARF